SVVDFLVVAGEFDDTTFGGKIAFEDSEASPGLEDLVEGQDDVLAGSLAGVGGLLGECAAGDGEGGTIGEFTIEEAAGDHRDATGLIDIGGEIAATGLDIDEDGSAGRDAVEVVNRQGKFGFAGHGEDVENGVGGTSAGGHTGNGIVEGLA